MLGFYNSSGDKRPLQHIVKNYCITRKNNGNDTLSFNLGKDTDEYKLIANETVIDDDVNRYLVKKINGDKFDCSLDLDFLKSTVYVNFDSNSSTLAETLRAHLPSGWTVSGANVRSVRRTIKFDYCTDYDIVQQCMKTYDVCFVWRINDTTLIVVDPDSIQPSGEYLTDELNLRGVSYKSETTKFVTRLYAYGKDGLTFASINDGKEYVENGTYSSKVVCGYWSDNRYTVKQSLLEDATKKVNELSIPVTSYECDVIDIAKQDPQRYSFLDFQIHKVVTLIDRERGLRVNHHIVQYKEYPDEPERNVITLSAVPETITTVAQKLESEMLDAIGETSWTLEDAIANATERIVYQLEGHVYIRHNEILIMDTEDPSTATGLWRWTYGGLGWSSTGYNGTYALALTNDGQIVADRITAGELNGVILKANSVQASAISQAFKDSIQSDITNTHATIIQEFTVADNAVKSVISSATSKYLTGNYDIDLFGYGTPDSQGYAASSNNNKLYLDQSTGYLYESNGQRWNKIDELELITDAMSSSFTQTVSQIRLEISAAQTNAETHANSYTDSKIIQTSDEIIATVSSSVQQYDFSEYYSTSQLATMRILYGVGTSPISSGGSYVDPRYYDYYYLDQSNGDFYRYVHSASSTAWTKVNTLHLITNNLGSRITQNSTSITTVVGRVDNLDTSVGTLSTNYTSLAGRVSTCEGEIDEQDERIDDAFSTITQTANEIKSTVAGAVSKYDVTGLTIHLYGYGEPIAVASVYNGKKYLDQSTGYVYTSNGSSWVKASTPLTLITNNLQTQITQNANEISLRVIKGDRTVSGSTVNDVISEINASSKGISLTTTGRLVITAGNFQLDASGNATMRNATFTGGTIKSSNYVADTSGTLINLSTGAISTKNFSLSSTGTITATNATLTGSLTTAVTDSSYLYVKGNKMEIFYDSKRIAYITPVIYANTYFQLGIMASGNYDGITIGGAYSGGWESYYMCNIQDEADNLGCRHYFNGDIKFASGKIKSLINFNDNVGCAWGGNVGLRYWNESTLYGNGLYLGITANSCNTYVVGGSCTFRCPTWVDSNDMTVQNATLYIRNGFVDIDDGNGIKCTGTIAFRWINYDALYVGMSGYNLKLVGSNIYANGSPVATTSDERKKTDIVPLTEKYLQVIKAIEPVSFKYDDDISISGRTHTGFTAQDVLRAMQAASVSTEDFAAFVDVDGDGKDYALRYEEFISPMLMYIKHLESRIAALERTG